MTLEMQVVNIMLPTLGIIGSLSIMESLHWYQKSWGVLIAINITGLSLGIFSAVHALSTLQ